MNDPILKTLELSAEKAGDITPDIYRRYFESCPESEELMSHIDDLVRGRMMQEVFRLIMTEDYLPETAYLNFEVANHKFAYSVLPHMYENLLDAVHSSVKHSIGHEWHAEFEEAWQSRIKNLLSEISLRQQKKWGEV